MAAQPSAAIVTVGTELTTGLRRDTNGGEIARRLSEAGYRVASLTSVADDPSALETLLRQLLSHHSLVVVTGGLGPTHDDITREAAAQALQRPLLIDEGVAARLEPLAARHTLQRSRDEMMRQALVIEGATVVPAVSGTAPGQVVESGSATLVLLPGPPGEMRPLLDAVLAGKGSGQLPERLRCAGVTESDVGHLVLPAIAPFAVDFTVLAGAGEVEVVLFARADAGSDLTGASSAARDALGDACYSVDGRSLPEVVLDLLRGRGQRLACAESCTGGLLGAALTDIPGSSEAFVGGVIAYSNELKQQLLGVPADTVQHYGAVSRETACAMAEGALRLGAATIAVSTTGIAGPGGGGPDKPVGLVWFGIARAGGRTEAVSRTFGGDRDMVRRRATSTALDLVRRTLLQGGQ